MFTGSHAKNVSLMGYIDGGLLDATYVSQRHAELVREMEFRGYNHKSPIDEEVCEGIHNRYHNYASFVDIQENLNELTRRCPDCAARIMNSGLKELTT